MRLFHAMRLSAIAALLAVCVMPAGAAASELPSGLANCADWQDARKQNLLEACSRHVGCALMLKSKNACPAAQDFVGKLEKTLAGKSEISNENVFHAAMPRLTQSKMMESMIADTRNSLANQKKNQVEGSRTYRNDAGEVTYYYEGGVQDEARHGTGIMIGSNGSARYGQFVDNAHTGRGWVYLSKGTMFVGSFSNNRPEGNVAFQDTNGVQIMGRMVNTNWNGIVHAITLNGTSHTKAFHDSNGNKIGKDYPANTPDQTVILAAQAALTAPTQTSGTTAPSFAPGALGANKNNTQVDTKKPTTGQRDNTKNTGQTAPFSGTTKGKTLQSSNTVLSLGAPTISRTLTLPAEYASLKPADVFVDFFRDGGINIFVGPTYEAARKADYHIGARNSGDEKTSCSQMTGKTMIAWFAILRVAHQLPPIGSRVDHHYTYAFVCGAASMEEAIAGVYDLAKESAGGRPFKTYALQAAVSAEVDPVQLRKEGRLRNALRPIGLAPWTFDCQFPINLDEAQATFMPLDPGSGQAFAEYIKRLPELREYRYRTYNADRSSTYETKSYFGCKGNYHTPLPDQKPPVFTSRKG